MLPLRPRRPASIDELKHLHPTRREVPSVPSSNLPLASKTALHELASHRTHPLSTCVLQQFSDNLVARARVIRNRPQESSALAIEIVVREMTERGYALQGKKGLLGEGVKPSLQSPPVLSGNTARQPTTHPLEAIRSSIEHKRVTVERRVENE